MSKKILRHSSIYLLRHGQAAPRGLLLGQSDYPLTAEGEAQISAWAGFFAGIPISAVWSSPLLRARQSAGIIIKALNEPVKPERCFIEPGFTEISLGEWDGLHKDEIIAQYPEEWKKRGEDFMNAAPPGGESFNRLSGRVLPALYNLYDEIFRHRHALVVAHQAVNRAILAALGARAESWRDIPQNCAALNELELGKTPDGKFYCNIIRINARPPVRVGAF